MCVLQKHWLVSPRSERIENRSVQLCFHHSFTLFILWIYRTEHSKMPKKVWTWRIARTPWPSPSSAGWQSGLTSLETSSSSGLACLLLGSDIQSTLRRLESFCRTHWAVRFSPLKFDIWKYWLECSCPDLLYVPFFASIWQLTNYLQRTWYHSSQRTSRTWSQPEVTVAGGA